MDAAAGTVAGPGIPLRELPRAAAIARVAAAKGWQHYVERLGLARLVEGQFPGATAAADDAQRLREALTELGPTFVKFGQMLATRSDLFPESFVRELAQLRSRVAPFSAEAARAIVEAELGSPIGELFATFEEAPLAAASIAQVHRATLTNGRELVVKVQRPGSEETIGSDLALLRYTARLLDRHVSHLQQYSLPSLVEEFADMITKELDFTREAANAERFAAANANETTVWVPAVIWPLSSRRVLTMEYSTGRAFDAEHPADAATRLRLASELVRLFLTQVFEHGVFHADPHAGNIFLLDDGRLCFHDFGELGRLNPRDQENLRQLFLAVVARDPAWLAETYLQMGGVAGEVDRAAFVRDLGQALDAYYAGEGRRESFGAIFSEFVRLARTHRVRLVGEMAVVGKAFATVESLARDLDPDFDSQRIFRDYAGQLVVKLLQPDTSHAALARSYRSLAAARAAMADLPIAARAALDQLAGAGLAVRLHHEQLGGLDRTITRAANRIALALIVGAIVVGASMLLMNELGR